MHSTSAMDRQSSRLPSIADRVTSSSSVFFTTASKLATAAVTAGGRSARGQQCLDGYDEGDEAAPKRNIEEGRAIQLGNKRLLSETSFGSSNAAATCSGWPRPN
jgi:hypothetical protein